MRQAKIKICLISIRLTRPSIVSDFSNSCLLTPMFQKKRTVFKSPQIPEIPLPDVCEIQTKS